MTASRFPEPPIGRHKLPSERLRIAGLFADKLGTVVERIEHKPLGPKKKRFYRILSKPMVGSPITIVEVMGERYITVNGIVYTSEEAALSAIRA